MRPNNSRAVTIRQVAEAAGVSAATVSRTLAGSLSVNPELRARVAETVDRLGYRTNPLARALRTKASRTVGFVVPNITNPFFPVVIQAIERQLWSLGLRLLLCDSGDDVGHETEQVRSLLDHRVDGLLISACDRVASRAAVRMAAECVPVVQVDRMADPDVDYVGVDHDKAMAAVVEHLAGLGCRRMCYVSPSTRISTAAERLRSYRRAVKEVDASSAKRSYVGDFSTTWGARAAERILSEEPHTHAVVCANDLIAIGVLQTLKHHRVRVPDEVMVTGFDDTILATVVEPQLTTVRQPLEALGARAVEILLTGPNAGQFQADGTQADRREAGRREAGGSPDGKGPEHLLLQAELVVRNSTRDPAIRPML